MGMKLSIFIVAFLFAAVGGAWFLSSKTGNVEANVEQNGEKNIAATSGRAKPVLVELFTSEGCSSCPPADRLLTAMSKEKFAGAETITLAYHVDYWDRLGWKDRFSSAEYSQRQEAYASKFGLSSIYTPQIVVDGAAEFVGGNRAKATEVIAKAPSNPAGFVDLALKNGILTINIRDLPDHGGSTVYLAIAESSLKTKVGAGENSGSTLEHTSVVRKLIPIGTIKNGEQRFAAERDVPTDKEWNTANLKYVVFTQENTGLKVIAVGAV